MPQAKHNLLFVMLDCLSCLCQAAVFCSHVPIPCLFIQCAVSFRISLVIPSWKMNTGFFSGAMTKIYFSRHSNGLKAEYQELNREEMRLQER